MLVSLQVIKITILIKVKSIVIEITKAARSNIFAANLSFPLMVTAAKKWIVKITTDKTGRINTR